MLPFYFLYLGKYKGYMFTKIKISLFYLFFFGAFGGFYPLLTSYFNHIGVGTPVVSMVVSCSLVIQLVTQPILGFISSKVFINNKLLVLLLLLITAISGLPLLIQSNFYIIFISFFFLSFGNASIAAFSDTFAFEMLENSEDYGFVRAWGAVGYAVMALVNGILISNYGFFVVPLSYTLLIFMSLFVFMFFPEENQKQGIKDANSIKIVFKNFKFLLFAIGGALIFGIHQSNNTFFSTFIESINGDIVKVGSSFFIVSLFEGLAMFIIPYLVKKFGLKQVIVGSAILVTIRWLFYGLHPTFLEVFPVMIVNGLAIGAFVGLAPQIVNLMSKGNATSTYHNVYWTIANSIGTMLITYSGGLVLKQLQNIFTVYLMFGIMGLIGVILIISSVQSKN